jgi:hypothetical protein
MSDILNVARAGEREPTRANVLLSEWELEGLAFGTRLTLEIGNAHFYGSLAGRGSICSDSDSHLQVVIEFPDAERLHTFLDSWGIVGSGRVYVE